MAAALSVAALLLGVALLASDTGRVDLLAEGPAEAPSSLWTGVPASGTASSLSLNPIDDALLTGNELTVSGPDGSEGKDRVGTTLAQVKTKLARQTQLWNTDKISEAELAGRLSRAIDQHEKCRRHWPHLEKVEAAQEVSLSFPPPALNSPSASSSPQLGQQTLQPAHPRHPLPRQVRVHDARNNLEVSNRAMERSRKELRDAEGLVLAARQVP